MLAAVGIVAMLATTLAGVLAPLLSGDTRPAARPPAALPRSVPPPTIASMSVRPVAEVRPAMPGECPPPAPLPPDLACDMANAQLYRLLPPTETLQLTAAQSVKSPTDDTHLVQIAMEPGSSVAFGRFTAENLNRQIAFLRDGIVVSAPMITAPLNTPSLQLSGDFTGEEADAIVAMVRNGR